MSHIRLTSCIMDVLPINHVGKPTRFASQGHFVSNTEPHSTRTWVRERERAQTGLLCRELWFKGFRDVNSYFEWSNSKKSMFKFAIDIRMPIADHKLGARENSKSVRNSSLSLWATDSPTTELASRAWPWAPWRTLLPFRATSWVGGFSGDLSMPSLKKYNGSS